MIYFLKPGNEIKQENLNNKTSVIFTKCCYKITPLPTTNNLGQIIYTTIPKKSRAVVVCPQWSVSRDKTLQENISSKIFRKLFIFANISRVKVHIAIKHVQNKVESVAF